MKPGFSRRLAALATGTAVLAGMAGMAASTAAAAEVADPAPRPTAAITRPPISIGSTPRPTPRTTGPFTLLSTLGIDLRATAKDCDTFAVQGRVTYSGDQKTGRYSWGPSSSRPELARIGSVALGGLTSLELENEYRIRGERGSIATLSIMLLEAGPYEVLSQREIGLASLCEKRAAGSSAPGRQVFATVQSPLMTLNRADGEGGYRFQSRGRCPGALRTFTGTITYNGPIPKTGEATVTYYWVRGENGVKSPPQTAVFTRSGQTVTVRDTWRPAAPSPTKSIDRETRSIELEKSGTDTLDDSPNPRTSAVLDRFQCTSE